MTSYTMLTTLLMGNDYANWHVNGMCSKQIGVVMCQVIFHFQFIHLVILKIVEVGMREKQGLGSAGDGNNSIFSSYLSLYIFFYNKMQFIYLDFIFGKVSLHIFSRNGHETDSFAVLF